MDNKFRTEGNGAIEDLAKMVISLGYDDSLNQL